MRQLSGTVSLVLLAACGGSNGSPEGATPVIPPGQPGSPQVQVIDPSVVVLDAAYSGLTDSLRVVVSDLAEWQRIWAAIHSTTSPMPPLPTIDFTRDRLLVAALGSRPSTGYAVRIDSVATTDGTARVYVTRRRPGASCVNGMVITAPVQVVRVSGGLGSVSFIELEKVVDC